MIYLDVDGVLVNFKGTAEKFGVKLKHNVFGEWRWCSEQCTHFGYCQRRKGYSKRAYAHTCKNPTPKKFYNVAEPQEWFHDLLDTLGMDITLLTKDYSLQKSQWINYKMNLGYKVIEAPDKSVHCKHPTDLLIDDNPKECERWRQKGGIAYWFNLAEENPFEKFLKWWRLK